MAELKPINFSVLSGELAAREALARLIKELEPLQLEVEESGTIELVLAEALNNIVEHAYPPDVPGEIQIGCEPHKDGLHFCVRDFGAMMPDGRMPIGQAHDLDVDIGEMPEGGFGWFMIQELAKDVAYKRQDDTNVLVLRIAVGLQQAA